MNFYNRKDCKLAGSLLLGAAAMTIAGYLSAAPMTSIADSWHNLGSGNTKAGTPNDPTGARGPANHTTDTGEICVFCHTPHGGDNTAAVPIWNRSLGNQVYTRYSQVGGTGTSTFDAQEAPIGSVTIACLSCHDGTQAIDSMLNAPGSGGYTAPGPGVVVPRLNGGAGFVGTDQNAGIMGNTDGNVIVQRLGTDLSDDHPVSMQFGGGGITAGNTAGQTVDPDFEPPTFLALGNGTPAWYIPGETTGIRIPTVEYSETGSLNPASRDRTDIILYTRNELGAEQPFVECGSCHDPHNVDNPTFLRISNSRPSTGDPDFNNADSKGGPSALCLTCHQK